MGFIPLIYRQSPKKPEIMPPEPMNFFGWLMNCCISDDRGPSGQILSEAAVFASGMVASGITLYLAGLYHLI
jgi:hypothetical protein